MERPTTPGEAAPAGGLHPDRADHGGRARGDPRRDRAAELPGGDHPVDARRCCKENLYRLRDLIDQYYVDKGQYPRSLEVLVEEGYLRKLPDGPDHAGHRLDPGLLGARPGQPGGDAGRLRRQELLRGPVARGHAVQRVVKAVGGGMTRAPRRTLLARGARRARRDARAAPRAGPTARRRTRSRRGEWDLAVARYTQRAREGPEEHRLQDRARERAHPGEPLPLRRGAARHIAANDFEKAAEELEIASKYDPANRSASDDLKLVRDRIRKREEEQQERARVRADEGARPGRGAHAAAGAVAAQPRADHDALRGREPAEDPREPRQASRA